ncbi:MAG: response regulator [Candidatus Brocadia sp.]|jgi:CheY-like chemotaxis protein/anti-sigma regulatory factor (Ser/Thr protein kinase)
MGKKILLVDDEETLRWALHEALTEEGYNVDNTNDGVNALEFIRKAHYDLVISDLRMPTMGGLQLISEIKKIRPDIKSVIITAYGSIEAVIEAMHIGVSDFMTKPFKIEHIKNVIQRVLNDTSTQNNTGLKIEYNDPYRRTNMCFLAKDMAGTAHHLLYDFVESGELRGFLFGGVLHDVGIINSLDIMIKTIFRYAVKEDKSSASLLNDINRYLCENILQRFRVELFCAILDKQRQTLFYSTYGEELTSILFSPHGEVKMLESFPLSLNMFPGITIVESSVSFLPGSKLVLIYSEPLAKGLRDGTITFESLRDVVSGANTNSNEDIAKSVKLRVRGSSPVAVEKDIAVMVSDLECETGTAWEEVITLLMPIHNYGKMVEHFDKKLSSIVEDDFVRYQIVTSINEAVLNAVSFAYGKNAEGEILLKFFKLGDEIIIEVYDRGCGFDIQNYREPDVTLYEDLTKKSGRGIFLMRNFMDRVMIQSSKEMGTAVHMAKRVAFNEN